MCGIATENFALYTLQYEYVVLYHSILYLLTLKINIKEVIENLGIENVNLDFYWL